MTLDLTAPEVRVLGALVEKDLSTPEYYPMTISALVTACNQKTNRDPVVEYSESDVSEAIESLQRKRLVGSSTSAHGRAVRYRHALVEVLELGRPQLAVLSLLMLRGPQTPGELRGRSARMHEFGGLEEVDAVLSELAESDPPLLTALERRPGQKETRYAHLLSGTPVEEETVQRSESVVSSDLVERVAALEQRVEELAQELAEFRRQFE